MRIALSTGGGDAPGLNAVIRSAVLSACNRGWEVLGIKKGYAGLLGEDEVIPMTAATVRALPIAGIRSAIRSRNPMEHSSTRIAPVSL